MGLNLTVQDDKWYSESYKNMVRSNKKYLLSKCYVLPVPTPSVVEANRYDFYKICHVLNIKPYMIWTVAYLNDIEDPYERMSIANGCVIYTIEESILNNMLLRSNSKTA